ncbi:MAG: lysophospholipid acyltransferase family protein, partial [Candidatus Latescibacteria bacterium]|nr:lysophospholipid acyltransferase family protein [Candidatus Latescibacterota bacterium]
MGSLDCGVQIAECGFQIDQSEIQNPKSTIASPPSPLGKRLKNGAIYHGVRGLFAVVNRLPRRVALDLCGLLGLCAYACATGTRRHTAANLRHAFGAERPFTDLRRMAVRVFWDLGRNAVDVVRLGEMTRQTVEALVQARGLEHLAAAHALGRGVIAISGHLGSFELLGAYLTLIGYPVTVVATPLYDPRLDAILTASRVRLGLRVVPRDRATPAVLRALRRGDVVGLLIDQDTRVQGTFVDFFGQPAYTPVGP